ncbi:xylulokinase [Cerasicoccus fimbriatus]|uniref:xylulokinase n=1 Tax=Cerasicoccus fimbriatus TaxID=3014554 RepID=UPI0022B48B1D|nr:FGGY family carbohydrate kinase [Cerasicoccus sp. TK19100]
MPHILGLDASTQSFSALVIDTDSGAVVADASVNFGQRLPQYQSPSGFLPNGANGEVHTDPLMWLDALELLLDDLRARCDLSQIAAISGAGQQHGSVYLNDKWPACIGELDANGKLSDQIAPCLARSTSPIWMDTATGEECHEIAESVGGNAEVCAKSGSVTIERFTGPQIRRFFKTSPADYAATASIHLVSSFVCSVLCGEDAPLDTGDGAGMNLLNVESWQWDDDLLDATAPGLRNRLPSVVPGAKQAGVVSTFFVEKFGFRVGTPVTVFTGDNPSSLVGMGASQPGKVVVSLGTSDTFFAAMPGIVTDPDGCGHVFGNPLGGPMSLQCFVNGSLAREEVKNRFGLDWSDFTAALKSTPAGNDGNVMLPFFRPEISPRLDLEAPVLSGAEGFMDWRDPRAAVRACVEGQFMNMKLRSAWMRLAPDVIYLTGGASQNDAIAQVAADIFQTRIERLTVSGSVAMGAAMRAANGCLGIEIAELEAAFCQPEAGSEIQPQTLAGSYDEALEQFAQLLRRQN